MEKYPRYKIMRPATFLFAMAILVGGAVSFRTVLLEKFVFSAQAEDEEEYENDDNYSNTTSSSPKTTTVESAPIYKTVLVTKIITTLDPIFTTDQDGDQLVDGLDPHPTIHEREYFTDDDGDGVPNIFDRHPNADDFAYYEEETDENGNGILDWYEPLEER